MTSLLKRIALGHPMAALLLAQQWGAVKRGKASGRRTHPANGFGSSRRFEPQAQQNPGLPQKLGANASQVSAGAPS